MQIFVEAGNVQAVKRANHVNEEGSSPLALVLHGAAILLRWKNDWDWFVNLAASDYPLIPQDGMTAEFDFLRLVLLYCFKVEFFELLCLELRIVGKFGFYCL